MKSTYLDGSFVVVLHSILFGFMMISNWFLNSLLMTIPGQMLLTNQQLDKLAVAHAKLKEPNITSRGLSGTMWIHQDKQ